MSTLFELPELPRHAEFVREPVGPHGYTMKAFNELLKRREIPLRDAWNHAETRDFLKRREAVLNGTWPLSVYEHKHECDCDCCSCNDVESYWHCPYCGLELMVDHAVDDEMEEECDHMHVAARLSGEGCGARFVSRRVGDKWRVFAVAGTTRRTTFP